MRISPVKSGYPERVVIHPRYRDNALTGTQLLIFDTELPLLYDLSNTN